jgi:TPP-dependent pyruvate/acetoin dehydrogenase alpha subunit
VNDAELRRIRAEIETEILAGLEFATNAPYPDASEVDQDVYS